MKNPRIDRNTRVIVQNTDDYEALTRRGIVRAANARLIRGSGVDVAGSSADLTRRSFTAGSLTAFTISACRRSMIGRGVLRGAYIACHVA